MPVTLTIPTPGRALIDITDQIARGLADRPKESGLVHLFVQHTSASLVIQENADPDVGRDLLAWLDAIAPEDGPYRHTAEGLDDMPAHLKAAVTSTSLMVPFKDGQLLLGTWQGIYLLEHRRSPHTRRVVVSFVNEN